MGFDGIGFFCRVFRVVGTRFGVRAQYRVAAAESMKSSFPTSLSSSAGRLVQIGTARCGVLCVGGLLLCLSHAMGAGENASGPIREQSIPTAAKAHSKSASSLQPDSEEKIPERRGDDRPGHLLEEMFRTLGPWAVFLLMLASGVGLHFPEDLIVIPAGWEIATGQFSLVATVLAAYLGVVGGDSGWFFLCRTFGSKLLSTHWFLKTAHPRRILETKAMFDRYGFLVLCVSRLVPGARTPSIAVAGLVHLRWSIFLSVELPMTVITVGAQLAFGYFAGIGIVHALHRWHALTVGVGIALIVATVIGVLVVRRQMAKGKLRLPRAKVAWLREIRGGSRLVARRARGAANIAAVP